MRRLDVKLRFAVLVFLAGLLLAACKDGDDQPRWAFDYDFESDAELDRFVWRCGEVFERSQDFATRGDYSLRIELKNSPDPGLKPTQFPKDWSTFSMLHFDVMNPGDDSVRIYLKIADRRETQYEQRVEVPLELAPGARHFAIALDSLRYTTGNGIFEREHVGLFKIYAAQPKEKIVLYFDRLYLE